MTTTYFCKGKLKDVSTRLIKPTLPEIDVPSILKYCRTWEPDFEIDGKITVFDEGICQYSLCDLDSHHRFYAALILGKPSLRCTIVQDEPVDKLDEETNNTFKVISLPQAGEEREAAEFLKQTLAKRGYRF